MLVFETERLVIRPWTHSETDVDRIYDTYSRWEVVRWLGASPRALENREQADAAVDRWAKRSLDGGRLGLWAVQVRDTGVVAGSVLLGELPDPDGLGGERVGGKGGDPGTAGVVDRV